MELLSKHIIDTVKEWQIKIGYMPGNMKLYYPAESLKALLKMQESCTAEELQHALEGFSEKTREVFGEVKISCDDAKERYCLDVSAKGTEYIAREIPTPEFLSSFLKTITTPGNSLEDVRACFAEYAQKHGIQYYEENQEEEGLGYTFSFEENQEEPYIYCVESDEFGLTYHRFDRIDYEKLKEEGHHHHG